MLITIKKAQAATELAILGSLLIVAFAFLVNYSEKINRQQSYLMQAFRQALGTRGSYTMVAYRRMANVARPKELGQLDTFSGSGQVVWGAGGGDSKYQFNDETRDLATPPDHVPGTTETSTNTYKTTTDATTDTVITDGNAIRTLTATDKLEAEITIDGAQQVFTHHLGADGKYYK